MEFACSPARDGLSPQRAPVKRQRRVDEAGRRPRRPSLPRCRRRVAAAGWRARPRACRTKPLRGAGAGRFRRSGLWSRNEVPRPASRAVRSMSTTSDSPPCRACDMPAAAMICGAFSRIQARLAAFCCDALAACCASVVWNGRTSTRYSSSDAEQCGRRIDEVAFARATGLPASRAPVEFMRPPA